MRLRRRLARAALVALALAGGALATAQAAAPGPAPAAGSSYVGAKACAGCHDKAWQAWRGSQHDLAMQKAGEGTVLGNFADAKFTYAGTTSTFFRRDGRYYVNTDGPDGKRADYEIGYTFGVYPLQQVLIEFPGGRLQALSIAWDARPKKDGGQRWFHLYPGQDIRAGDPLHWTGPNQNWNFMCAECHSTNLRKGFDAASGEFRTTWAEIDVGCEACHGPGANHLAWAKRARESKGDAAAKPAADGMGLALALDERKGVTWTPDAETGNAKRSVPRTSAREVETCARCHARTSRISDDFVHGRSLLDSHRPVLLDEGLYWDDGQMRDEVYNWGSFLQSEMFAKGVTCSDCHDPHTLKTRAPGNAVCAQCHRAAKYDEPAHTHHPKGTPGAACAACHMPTTTYMVVDPRHDHSMRIPRPDLSAKLGVPNACNGCHAKRTPQWAAETILRWTGKSPTGYQKFAEAFRAGATGAPGGRGALVALADDKAQPAIVRASAIERLGRWLTPTTIDLVARAANDPDPVVRLAVAEALANADPQARLRYLPRLAADPVLAVRIEAAHALAGPLEARLPASERGAVAKAIDEYAAVQRYNADRPEGRMNLGNLYALRGDYERAEAEYKKALAIDPTFVAAYVNLADLDRARGAEADALRVLREGLARAPKAAPLHYALGLALVRARQLPEAMKELAAAVRLDPANPRYAYVQAVALHDTGHPREALQVLEAARKRNAYDRDVLAALAQYQLAAGNRAAALAAASTLRELEPENPQYARLAREIEGRPLR